MQPLEERPRQMLFRQFLLKPALLVLPIWVLLWLLNCIELLIGTQVVHPFYYFVICHMVLPAILVHFLFRMQAADEQLCLEQRTAREADATGAAALTPFCAEDPPPALLRELICA